MATAILGWGSLIWDVHPCFKEWHDDWQADGPQISLEFSRVSKSRLGALTLVIDQANGEPCTVMYAMSKRKHFVDAVADLRCRESCNWQRIGTMEKLQNLTRPSENAAEESIRQWAIKKQIEAVIWTALESNFEPALKQPFTVDNAQAYLKNLAPVGKVKAAEYIWCAPSFVNTPLRRAVQVAPWF